MKCGNCGHGDELHEPGVGCEECRCSSFRTLEQLRVALLAATAEVKPSLSLLPWAALPEVAEVMQSGVAKHGAHGWREPGKHTTAEYVDKVLRHLAAHLGGVKLDAESGKRHLAHAAADLLIALELDPR